MPELTENQAFILDHHKKQYDRNLKTWAIDRALETIKSSNFIKIEPDSAKELLRISDMLCDFIVSTPKEWPIPTEAQAEYERNEMQVRGEV